jgi:hypothetical protein
MRVITLATLDEIAQELAGAANLENVTEGVTLTGMDLLNQSIVRRLGKLGVPEQHFSAVGCTSLCLPACHCTAHLLLLAPEALVQNVIERSTKSQQADKLNKVRKVLTDAAQNAGVPIIEMSDGRFSLPIQGASPGALEGDEQSDDCDEDQSFDY